MGTSSRIRILEYIARHGETAIGDLSRGLHLTLVTTRHHVDALAREGLVTRATLRRKPGPGRPEVIYRPTALANSLLPRNYSELGGAVLAELLAAWPSESTRTLMVSAARRIAATLPPPRGRTARDRLVQLSSVLESRGYLPSVETTQSGSTMQFANCPYREIAGESPWLCRFDVTLVELALGCDVRLVSSISAGDTRCRLLVGDEIDAVRRS